MRFFEIGSSEASLAFRLTSTLVSYMPSALKGAYRLSIIMGAMTGASVLGQYCALRGSSSSHLHAERAEKEKLFAERLSSARTGRIIFSLLLGAGRFNQGVLQT